MCVPVRTAYNRVLRGEHLCVAHMENAARLSYGRRAALFHYPLFSSFFHNRKMLTAKAVPFMKASSSVAVSAGIIFLRSGSGRWYRQS